MSRRTLQYKLPKATINKQKPHLKPRRCLIDDVLPDKLLEDIMLIVATLMLGRDFHTLQDVNPRPLNAPLTMSHVSQRWRRVALDCARLWSTIHVLDDAEPITEALGRSGEAALTIQLGAYRLGRYASKINTNKVLQHSRRIRFLKLALSKELDRTLADVPYEVYDGLTMLEEVIILCNREMNVSSWPGVSSLAEASLPRLRSFQMDAWGSGSLVKLFLRSALRILALQFVSSDDHAILLQALPNMPLLEGFSLSTCFMAPRAVHLESPTRDISLPHLRSLQLDDFCSCLILPKLLIPSTCSLRLDICGTFDHAADFAKLLPLLSPHLPKASRCRLDVSSSRLGRLYFQTWREPLSLDEIRAYVEPAPALDPWIEVRECVPSVAVYNVQWEYERPSRLDFVLSSPMPLSDVTSLYLCEAKLTLRLCERFENLQELVLCCSLAPRIPFQETPDLTMLAQSTPPVLPQLRTLALRSFNWCEHRIVPRHYAIATLADTMLSVLKARHSGGLTLHTLTISEPINLKDRSVAALQQSQTVDQVLYDLNLKFSLSLCSTCQQYRERRDAERNTRPPHDGRTWIRYF